MDNIMEAYNWQLAQMWLGKIKDIIGKYICNQ